MTHHIPPQPTTFIGRADELAQIARLLADPACRLFTLVGAGGIGKTRLAMQAAVDQLPHFAHGVYFVPLTPVGSPDLIAAAIAGAFQVSFSGSEDHDTQIIRFLREKHVLLVMDNFEHLLDGTRLLTMLLQSATHVKILVTSRERLNTQEEWVFTVDGLSFPTDSNPAGLENYSAVQLFVQRARQAQTKFSLSENAQAIQQICQQVEGMPLGLELAASWLRVMSCRQIVAQMAGNLDFLTTLMRNIPERHRSLRAVFEQSWNLLSASEQSVLMKLSVFRGGFDVESAGEVAGASLPTLAALVDKSLIRLNAAERYDLHELLRQYAADKLADAGEVNTAVQRHLDYFLKLAEQAEAHAFGREQLAWFDHLEIELDNIRAALTHSVESETGLRFVAALGWFFAERAYWVEGPRWLDRALAANPNAPALLRSKALHSAGAFAGLIGIGRARMLCEEALTLARSVNDRWNMAWALCHLGLYAANDPDESAAFLEESLALFRQLEDPMGLSHTLVRRAWRAIDDQQDFGYARVLLEEAATIASEAGDRVITAWAVYTLGRFSWLQDHDLPQTKLHFETSLALFREARFQVGTISSALALVEQMMGNLERAQTLYRESLMIQGAISPNHDFVLAGLASIAAERGQFERAAILLGTVHSSSFPEGKLFPETANYTSDIALVRKQLSEAAFAEAWREGEAMTPEQAIAYALEDKAAETAEPSPNTSHHLTPREIEILCLIAEGLSNRKIAEQLFLSPGTVKWYLSEIYGKLGVNGRMQAVAHARTLNLLN